MITFYLKVYLRVFQSPLNLPSQAKPLLFNLKPDLHLQLYEPGLLTHSCSHWFIELFLHSSMSTYEKKKKRKNSMKKLEIIGSETQLLENS